MNEINMEHIEDYQLRKPFKTGGSSVAMVLTGLVDLNKKYVCWKDGDTIYIKEKKVL